MASLLKARCDVSQLQADFTRIFATNPAAPPPISPQELQRLRNQAWAEVAATEASDGRYYRALRDQVQHNAHMGVWS